MPDVNSQLSCEFMPRDFSMNSQRGVNSCAMNSVISHDAHKTSPWGGAEENTPDERHRGPRHTHPFKQSPRTRRPGWSAGPPSISFTEGAHDTPGQIKADVAAVRRNQVLGLTD